MDRLQFLGKTLTQAGADTTKADYIENPLHALGMGCRVLKLEVTGNLLTAAATGTGGYVRNQLCTKDSVDLETALRAVDDHRLLADLGFAIEFLTSGAMVSPPFPLIWEPPAELIITDQYFHFGCYSAQTQTAQVANWRIWYEPVNVKELDFMRLRRD